MNACCEWPSGIPEPILIGVGLLFVGSLVLMLFLGQELFPQVDAGQIVITMRTPTGTRVEATETIVAQVEKAIREEIGGEDLAMIISELGVVPDWSSAYTPNSGPQDALIKVQLTDERFKECSAVCRPPARVVESAIPWQLFWL